MDRRELFSLDVNRSTLKLTKATFQNRARQDVVLLRLDVAGAPHTNPDGSEVACPHLHIYREGYGDKWAIPSPPELLNLDDSLYLVLHKFMDYCNVTETPSILEVLF